MSTQRELLGAELSAGAIAAGGLPDALLTRGYSIPAAFLDYLASREGVGRGELDILHAEYVRELLGVLGDTSALLPTRSQGKTLPYRSSAMESRRQSVLNALTRGTELRDLPRSRWEMNPYLRVHWKLVEGGGAREYEAFIHMLAFRKRDATHLEALQRMRMQGLLEATTYGHAFDALADSPDLCDCTFERDPKGRYIVISRHLGKGFDFAFVLDDVSVNKQAFRPFLRLVDSSTTDRAGAFGHGFLFQFPLTEILPGSHLYQNAHSRNDFAVGVAFFTSVFLLLARKLEEGKAD